MQQESFRLVGVLIVLLLHITRQALKWLVFVKGSMLVMHGVSHIYVITLGMVVAWYSLLGNRTIRRLKTTGVDLIANPDRALDLDVAVPVLINGMLEGWFSGKKLRDYIGSVPTRSQYVNARHIINGTDRADLIAGYAVIFEEALRLGEWQ
jgi:hypothetical protein